MSRVTVDASEPGELLMMSEKMSFRYPTAIGVGAILSLVATIGCWSFMAPIASATLAIGTVVVETDRKVVQHLDGGIVRTLSVKDGDYVSVGQTLIQLDDSRLKSALETIRPLLEMNNAQRVRIHAEQTGAERLSFVQENVLFAGPLLDQIRQNQVDNFVARRDGLSARIQALETERHQHKAALTGLQQQGEACTVRSQLVKQDVSAATELASGGFGTRQHVRDVQRLSASLAGECANLSAQTQETEQKIAQTFKEVNRVKANFAESVGAESQQLEREHFELLDRFLNASEQLGRSTITSPVSGRVVNLIVHTEGSVIGPGMPLMEIVPEADHLIIEAQIRPADIDAIAVDQVVRLRVSGGGSHQSPMLNGSILSVSADRIFDRQRVGPFFLVRIGLSADELGRLKKNALRPGMSVELMITNGEKTVAELLVSPLFEFFSAALHE